MPSKRALLSMKNKQQDKCTDAGFDHAFAKVPDKKHYFEAVSWLAAIGTLIAAILVVACPITDGIWLFSQTP